LPQDVQTEAFDFPEDFFSKRVWTIPRARCDRDLLARAAAWIRAAKQPLIIAGGGVLFSAASEALAQFAATPRIPLPRNQCRQRLPSLHSSSATRSDRSHWHVSRKYLCS